MGSETKESMNKDRIVVSVPVSLCLGMEVDPKKMHDYEKIRRLFFFGMSAFIYYKYILPDLVALHKRSLDMDIIATSMINARGDLIPPKPVKKYSFVTNRQVMDHNSNCL